MVTAADGRIESDALGERVVPSAALYGVNTVRGVENFPFAGARFGEFAANALDAVVAAVRGG